MARVSETLDDAITNAVAEIARESLSISMAGDGPWWQPAGRKLGGIPYHEWTWDDLDVCRRESQRMMTHNEFGIGGTTKRIDYVVDQGFKYSIVDGQGEVVRKADIEQLNEYLELITSANSFPELEAEIVARMDRDGEVFIRLFWNDDGIVDVRFVEPARVRPGPDADTSMNSIERWGIAVEPHDAKRITGYWIEPGIGETPELVPEAEIVHITHNNGGAIPRGIPVYQPVFENLRRCEDLLTGMSSIAKARAKIALIRKIAGLNAVKAENIKSRLTTGTQQNPDGTVRNVSIDEYPFGSVIRANQDETFEFPSSNVGAADLIQVLQADLRSIASLLSMPEWMFTGLADQKYSNAFVVEAPTLKAFRRLQGKLVKGLATGRYKSQASVLWRCLRMAADRRIISKEVLAKCKVKCVPPSLEARDKQSESSVNKTYLDAGVIDKQTVQESIGLDPVETNRRIAAEKAAAPPAPPMIPGAKPPAGPLPPKLTKVGESWYTRRALEWIAEGYDRSHLIKTKIIDRNNVARTVYKRPAKLKPRQPQEYKVEPPKKPTMYDITKQVFGPPVVRMERANKDLPDLTRGYLKSPTGIDAVREYGGAGAGINEHLWADKPIPEKFQEMDADLQDIFADTPKLPKPITTYRGMSTDSDKADFARFQELAKSGGEWQTKGYMSTTTKAANVARGGDFGGDGIVYEIEANHGIDVGPVGLIGASSQAELLLDKGSRFKVVGATQVDRFKYRVKLIQVSSGGDAVQVGESWYSLDALEWITEGRDRSHLVKTKVTDKNGVSRTVYKVPAGYHKTGSEHAKDKAVAKADAVSRVQTKLAAPEKLKAADIQSLGEDLKSMTRPEIQSLRKELGLVGDSKKSKQELVDQIKEHAASLRKVPYGLKELTPEQKKAFDKQDARRNTLHELLTRSGFATGKAVAISDLTTSLGKYGLDNVQSNLAVSEMVDSGYLKPESEGSKKLIPGDSWEPKSGVEAVTTSVDAQTERQKKWQARAESLNRVIPPWVSKLADALDRLIPKPFVKESLDADVDPFELADSFIESLLDAAENDPSAVDLLLAMLNGGADGTVDLQDEAAVQVGESWYSLDALEWITEGRDRSHLVKVKRQDKNGVNRYVYVTPAGYNKTGSEHGKAKVSPEKKANQRSEAEHSAYVEQLTATAQKIKAGTHTSDELKSFTDGLSALTVAEIAGIKQQLGVKGGKVKADHIAKVAAFAQQQRQRGSIQLTTYRVDQAGKTASNALFGKTPSEQEFAKMGCAVDGSIVSVEGYVDGDVNSVSIYVRSDASIEKDKIGLRASRQIYRDYKGNLICENFSFKNDSEVTGKFGTEIFRDQVQELRKWGIKEIETVGVGNKLASSKRPSGSPDQPTQNGYYTWPRLGYSGDMSEEQFLRLPSDIQSAMGESRDVRKLFDEVPGGPEAWKEHGDDISLRFDLSDNSVNMVALQKYLTKRGL